MFLKIHCMTSSSWFRCGSKCASFFEKLPQVKMEVVEHSFESWHLLSRQLLLCSESQSLFDKYFMVAAAIFVCAAVVGSMETTKHQKSNDVEIGLSSCCSASFGPGHHLMQVLLPPPPPLTSHINWAFNVNYIFCPLFEAREKRAFLQLGLSISTPAADL